ERVLWRAHLAAARCWEVAHITMGAGAHAWLVRAPDHSGSGRHVRPSARRARRERAEQYQRSQNGRSALSPRRARDHRRPRSRFVPSVIVATADARGWQIEDREAAIPAAFTFQSHGRASAVQEADGAANT